MVNELWEIVRVDQLKVGDVVLDLRGGVIESYEIDPELVEIAKGSPKSFYPPKLRRVDPADDPRVLRRALEIASSQLLEAMHAMMERKSPKPSVNDVKHYIDNCISRAVGELETEALDAT